MQIPFGAGLPLAIAGVAGLLTAIGTGVAMVKADDMAYGDNMLVTKNKGAIMLNNNDSVVAGTNLLGGGGGGFDFNRFERILGDKLKVNVSQKYDSFRANSSTAINGRYQSITKNTSKFD